MTTFHDHVDRLNRARLMKRQLFVLLVAMTGVVIFLTRLSLWNNAPRSFLPVRLFSMDANVSDKGIKPSPSHQFSVSPSSSTRIPSTLTGTSTFYRSLLMTTPRWTQLDNNNPNLFVYAAHYDDTGTAPFVVAILSGPEKTMLFSVVCIFFDSPDVLQPSGMVRGTCQNYNMFERFHFGLYRGAFVNCPLHSYNHRPYAVSIVKWNASLPDSPKRFDPVMANLLAINYGGRPSSGAEFTGSAYKWNITKCFPALYGHLKTTDLVQQIEMHRLFGVDHFVFYQYSAKPEIQSLLRYYEKEGVVDVYNWTLPKPQIQKTQGVFFCYFDQKDAVQDCLLRYRWSSRYLLFGDLDELFVPRSRSSLLSVLNHNFMERPECAGFLFRNTFFDIKTQAKDTDFRDHQFAEKHNLKSLIFTRRVNEIWKAGKRSKPAVIPTRVNVVNVHDIINFRGNYTRCEMSPSEGLLHHYRKIPYFRGQKHDPNKYGYVSDPYLRKFTTDFVRRVEKVLQASESQWE